MANTLVKAKSASQLSKIAMIMGTPSRGRSTHLDSDLNTLPDPRTPSPSSRTRAAESHPDLSHEVALLSTKLVNAINHQTNLDDTLQQTRHELDATKRELDATQRKLNEAETKCEQYARMIANGVLIKKIDSDKSIRTARAEMSEAQKQRDVAEKGRKEMEVELENLTTALFEEANTMVAAARKESEATEKKNAQLRSQLNDTELLLASQQEQLADLKNVMERMSSERDETETVPRSSTAPSTPGHDTSNKMSQMFDAMPMSPNTPVFNEYPPDQPLRFSHLITPVMRSDIQAYIDFADLLKTSRAAAAPSHSRPSSGLTTNTNASNSSSFMTTSSQNMPGSFSGVTSSPRDPSNNASSLPPLKDNKFFKRCLAEDIEPALRLDLAPGLSWLARRTVVSSITAGTLLIEPFIPQSRFYGTVYACSLCGESRRNEVYTRRHRFRTSEDDSAQRYPLCEYCLGRLRATCDFLGFLRMVRDGHWRAQTDEDVAGAWEECVRLREKMFWTRLGGGVVPCAPPISVRTESPFLQHRRIQGSLLRRTSSDFSTTAKISHDHIETASVHSDGESLGVPKLRAPSPSKKRGQSIASEYSQDDSVMNDSAITPRAQSEATSTSITEDEDRPHAHLEASLMPKEDDLSTFEEDNAPVPSEKDVASAPENEDAPISEENNASLRKENTALTLEEELPSIPKEDHLSRPKSQMSDVKPSEEEPHDENMAEEEEEEEDKFEEAEAVLPGKTAEEEEAATAAASAAPAASATTETASSIPGSFD